MKISKDDSTYISRGDWLNVGKALVLIAQKVATQEDIKRVESMLVQLGAKKSKSAKAKK